MAHRKAFQRNQPKTIVPDEATGEILENIAKAPEVDQLVRELDIDADAFKAFLKATGQENSSDARTVLRAAEENQKLKDRSFKP